MEKDGKILSSFHLILSKLMNFLGGQKLLETFPKNHPFSRALSSQYTHHHHILCYSAMACSESLILCVSSVNKSMICDNMTALPHSKSNKDKDLHVALWNKCTIETECQLHYNMNRFPYDTLYSEGPSLCIYDSDIHSNRGSRCENHVCTTLYYILQACQIHTQFHGALYIATNYMVPDPAEEFSKQGARAPNTTLPGYHDCIWFRHWQCQMPQRQTGGPGPGVTVYRGVVTVLTCAPVSPPV